MDWAEEIAVKADFYMMESRLRDLRQIACTDRSDRVRSLLKSLSYIKNGAYLLGCGPYNTGVYHLSVDEIRFGRSSLFYENSSEKLVDYHINDTGWMSPREVSKNHAVISCQDFNGEKEYYIADEGSSTGTYVNGKQINNSNDVNVQLAHGDLITFGPLGINHFIFIKIS